MTPPPYFLYDMKWLLEQDPSNLEYLFFWNPNPKEPNIIDESCLSQFYARSFTEPNLELTEEEYTAKFPDVNVIFPTAVHYMMWFKAEFFNDKLSMKKILVSPDPAKAKATGREVKNFNKTKWWEIQDQAVFVGNMKKFGQHADLKKFLYSTGNKILVEANPYDIIWGNGLRADDPRVLNPLKWKGLNKLGFTLMRVRDIMKTSEERVLKIKTEQSQL